MKTKLFGLFMTLITLFLCVGCSTEVENNNTIIIPGSNGTELVKTGSNLLVNVGENKYGTNTQMAKSKVMTRASVETSTITITTNDQINTPTIGLYSNYAWNTYINGQQIYVGTSNGYLFATTSLATPYKTEWNVNNTIDNGVLTLTADKIDDKYYKPIPVTFWGNHSLVTSSVEKTLYDPNDGDWKNMAVTSATKSVAISKSIEYANSAIKLNLTLGQASKVIGWYDNKNYNDPNNVASLQLTKVNINNFPEDTTKQITVNGTTIKFNQIYNAEDRKVGNFFHYTNGNVIKITDENGKSNYCYVGSDKKNIDKINFEVKEVRITSSKSCTYKNDYLYVPSNDSVTYKYELKESLQSGDNAVFSIMPTTSNSSIVIMKCQITDLSLKNLNWCIKESTKENSSYKNVGINSIFYIIGKVSTSSKTVPTGSSYATTWNKGIYCPDVITNVNVNIDDISGAIISDPDGSDDTDINKIYYNYDYEYGTMDGVWTTGNTTKN